MTPWTLFWCIVFGVATTLFFVTAVVITVNGARDLRDLLSGSDRTAPPGKPPQEPGNSG